MEDGTYAMDFGSTGEAAAAHIAYGGRTGTRLDELRRHATTLAANYSGSAAAQYAAVKITEAVKKHEQHQHHAISVGKAVDTIREMGQHTEQQNASSI